MAADRRRTARFGAFIVSLVQHGAFRVRMSGDNFGNQFRTVRILFILDGEYSLKTAGTVEVLPARSAAMAVGWRPIEVETLGAKVIEVDIAVERTNLRGSFDDSPLVVWPADTVLPSATAAALREIVANPGTTDEIRDETSRVVETLVTQVATLRPIRKSTTMLEQVERTRITKYITRHHTERDLTPAKIAEEFGVSTRTLHRLFEGEDVTIMALIAQDRLRSALTRLRDPRYSTVTLEDVAELCGYGSALALRRAVWAATQKTPSEVRAQAEVANKASAEPSARGAGPPLGSLGGPRAKPTGGAGAAGSDPEPTRLLGSAPGKGPVRPGTITRIGPTV